MYPIVSALLLANFERTSFQANSHFFLNPENSDEQVCRGTRLATGFHDVNHRCLLTYAL